MITGTIEGIDAFDDILAFLHRIRNVDLGPLARRIADIVAADVRSRLADGESAGGADFAPLRPSTIRRNHGATRMGGSLGSTVSVDLDIQADRVEVAVGWAGARGKHAAFFSGGTSRQVARPLQGISDPADGLVADAIDEFLRSVLDGR